MNYKNKKKFILIGLNELNFDLIEKYIKKNNLKNLKKLLDKVCFTTSETDYKNLEPWIQWPSIYFEKKAKEHGIFRLGDGKNYKYNSIFEKLDVVYSTKRPKADQSPGESIKAGLASCTGLSILLISACRSVGIPARADSRPAVTA